VEAFGFPQRKKKVAKKKERFGRGSLWKLAQPWKSKAVAFGDILLMDSHSCLKKPPQKTLRLSHSYHRLDGGQSINPFFKGPRLYLNGADFWSDEWGAPH